ncbi:MULTISPECIES: hypothetical protein [Bacillus]|uniref:hypothetical protein n=1 Tax=Bacillus TaxID=1386 RepID=UPI00227EE4FA|nr:MULTISPECIES: hypothetical protein [Bacillus]MCY7464305.1 hypothetical protein [Bacillus safensis]MED1528783.1 hypothetical protein [Bacillus pumilus]
MDKLLIVIERIISVVFLIAIYLLWSIAIFIMLYQSVFEKNYLFAFTSLFLFAILTSAYVVKFYKDVILKKKQQTECNQNE